MTTALLLVLAIAVFGLLYPWVFYPLWLRLRARRWSLITMARNQEVSVSVIIPAFNRESVILRKLRNTLRQDYPAELMEVLVVADGCTDRTEQLVKRVRDPRVRLISLPRGGRLASLRQTVLRARGEILVFTDANVSLRRSAIRRMVRNFADWHVGGVCGAVGTRKLRKGDALGLGESLFARHDGMVRRLEGQLGSVFSADSSLYAIRRGLFSTPRNLAQADDMAISMRIVLAGKRLVYEPGAVCFREVQPDGAREMTRRRYMVNYSIRSLLDLGWSLAGKPGYAWSVLSHTLARYLTPVWLIVGTFAACALALEQPSFWPVLVPPALFIVLTGIGWSLRQRLPRLLHFLALPAWSAAMNRAMLFGMLAALAGWRPVGAKPRSQTDTPPRPVTADLADTPDEDLMLDPPQGASDAGGLGADVARALS